MGTNAMETPRTRGATGKWFSGGRAAVKAAMIAGVAATALLVAACGSSGSSTSSPPAGGGTTPTAAPASAPASGTAMLKTETSSLGTVLANSQGLTLYWFAADHGTTSACSGACAAAWPPVIGTPQAMSGVTLTGTLGTITRSDGTMQATWNGHPLYTFKADTAPGQVNGNKVNGFGAMWYAVTLGSSSGTGGGASTAPTTSKSGWA